MTSSFNDVVKVNVIEDDGFDGEFVFWVKRWSRGLVRAELQFGQTQVDGGEFIGFEFRSRETSKLTVAKLLVWRRFLGIPRRGLRCHLDAKERGA